MCPDSFDEAFQQREGTLCFVFSRMRCVDEESERGKKRIYYLSFEDWLVSARGRTQCIGSARGREEKGEVRGTGGRAANQDWLVSARVGEDSAWGEQGRKVEGGWQTARKYRIVLHPCATVAFARLASHTQEAIVRCATMKALPTTAELERVGASDAGGFVIDLKSNPAAYTMWVHEREPSFDGPLRQPIEACVSGIVHLILRTIERSTNSEDGNLRLSKKEVRQFRSSGGATVLASGNALSMGGDTIVGTMHERTDRITGRTAGRPAGKQPISAIAQWQLARAKVAVAGKVASAKGVDLRAAATAKERWAKAGACASQLAMATQPSHRPKAPNAPGPGVDGSPESRVDLKHIAGEQLLEVLNKAMVQAGESSWDKLRRHTRRRR